MYEKNVKTDKFLTPKDSRYNSGFGEDIAQFYFLALSDTNKYIISNVLEQNEGYGFWLNLKRERFWLSFELINSTDKIWKIKLKPIGLTYLTYFIMGKTFRGERIIKDIEQISTFSESLLNI